MLFNSLEFLIFLPVVFCCYWLLQNYSNRLQNLILLISGFVFYGWWDWRFLGLMIFSASIDYACALHIKKNDIRARAWLMVSIVSNLTILGFFKYFNFFVETFEILLDKIGIPFHGYTLQIILPLGISFYTFQAMAYVIDVYRGRIEAVRDPIVYFVFISFFPQLVAGPIERAQHLIPQFEQTKKFDAIMAKEGLRMILWGFLKKCVIADQCAVYVEPLFDDPTAFDSSALWIGLFYFSIQIYADFSGYSDIAWGLSRLFGIQLMRNFNLPYFSIGMLDFWKRWHISLSSWFRDYLYIPLGGNKISKQRTAINIFTVFLLSGLWHGAKVNFIIWGTIHGIAYIVCYFLFHVPSKPSDYGKSHALKNGILLMSTFIFVSLCWVFFRANNMDTALDYFSNLFSFPVHLIPQGMGIRSLFPLIIFCMAIEYWHRDRAYTLSLLNNYPVFLRWLAYGILLLIILLEGNFNKTEFIYFAF